MYSCNDLLDCEYYLLTENDERLLSYDDTKDFLNFSLRCLNPFNVRFYCTSSLLLGNGFSIAYNQNFDLSNLTKQMISANSIISNIFQHLQRGNLDIEETMKIVNDSKKVLECFYWQNKNPIFCNAINSLEQFSDDLKKQLIATIQTNHIPNIDNNAKISALNFIGHYNHIFTVNYDLLLYWVLSHNNYPFNDSFGYDANKQLVFQGFAINFKYLYFLHGALHLFYDKGNIIKLLSSQNHSNLLEQIKDRIENNSYPICITAGSADEKLEMIKGNYYLSRCFDALNSLQDYNLVVFGTYLKDNDKHIRDVILQSGVKNIFFGVSSYDKIKLFEDFIQEANARGKNIFFYDYKSIDVWGNNSNP